MKKMYRLETDSVINELNRLASLSTQKTPLAQLQKCFLSSRLHYKKIEAVAEYYFQGLTRRINGPALPDVKPEDGVVWPPHGFQVIEQMLFSQYSDTAAPALAREINLLITDLKFTVTHLKEQTITPRHLQELIQHQVIRIAALGITGFDAPLSQYSLPETASSLKGIQLLLQYFAPQKPPPVLAESIAYINQNDDFPGFDRLTFMKSYLMPLSDWVALVYKDSAATSQPYYGGLSGLLRGKAFNADYFANYAIAAANPAKVNLGRKLFYDNILSQSRTISCASCHQPELYFTDGLAKAENFVHGGTLGRNTPTVLYAGFQNNQFYDLRSVSLEDQINEVMNSKNEFNLGSGKAIAALLKTNEYRILFEEAFNTKDSINSFQIRNAIAAYMRSLSSFSSPFDQYMNGAENALSPEQKEGFNLFAGKAKCATCHFIPLFNGTIPPWYNKTESEVIGVPRTPVWNNAAIDSDSGRYAINRFPEFLYAFKTPTIRNIAQTAPYMHNGVYKTLDEVLSFYQKGGGIGIGINLPNQSLPFDSLNLNRAETKAIIAFMQSLTDKKYEQ